MSLPIIGYYGCPCHPYETIEEYKSFLRQKIEIEAKYKRRHTGEECIAKEILAGGFIVVFVEPYDCPRCQQTEHIQNLIKIN